MDREKIYNKEKGTTQQPHRFYVGKKKELCGKQKLRKSTLTM